MLSREALQILARKGRIELIRTLRAYTDEDFTINELARVSGVPTMTTWRAIKDLKKAGLVKTRRVGNAISVLLTDDKEKLRSLKIVPETDPQRTAAELYASRLGSQIGLEECRLFGNIGRGVHAPGEDIDVAVVFNDEAITEGEAKLLAGELASKIKAETNVAIVPFCIARRDMGRRGGLAAELRDKEVIWSR